MAERESAELASLYDFNPLLCSSEPNANIEFIGVFFAIRLFFSSGLSYNLVCTSGAHSGAQDQKWHLRRTG